jgi:hypothetical protein
MNTNIISLVGLLVSVFFAGSYLRGEIGRRQEMKAELRALKDEQARSMARVDSVNAVYEKEKLELLQQTKQFYDQLDTILDMKLANNQAYRRVNQQLNDRRDEVTQSINRLQTTIQTRRLVQQSADPDGE